MFEHLYPRERDGLAEHRRALGCHAPLGCYVSFRERLRERLIAVAVGILLGLSLAAVLVVLGAPA